MSIEEMAKLVIWPPLIYTPSIPCEFGTKILRIVVIEEYKKD